MKIQCQVCLQSTTGTQYSYAKCEHVGFCKKCCEIQFQKDIRENKKIPKCLSGCNAPLRQEGNNCMLLYFSQKHQSMWKQFKKTIRQETPCTVPDCPGLVKAGKCLACGKFYCEKCGEYQHKGVKCFGVKQEQIIADTGLKIKKCPQCHIPITRSGGCYKIVCSKCEFQFCFECLAKWKQGHQNQHGISGQKAHVWGAFTEFLCCFSRTRPKKS